VPHAFNKSELFGTCPNLPVTNGKELHLTWRNTWQSTSINNWKSKDKGNEKERKGKVRKEM
jgi:hypothetical protein